MNTALLFFYFFIFFSLFPVSQPERLFFLLLNKQTYSGCETDAENAMIS